MPIAELDGRQYDFPEGTTSDEMMEALDSLPKNYVEKLPEDKREPFAEENVILKDEGVKKNKEGSHVAYRDSKKNPTGGHGHLLTDEEQALYPKGTEIPDSVADGWFTQDMKEADELLTSVLEDKKVYVPDDVYSILLNMTFNMGSENLLEFDKMWAAIEVGDWEEASKEMLDSKWHKTVGNRAVRLAQRMAAIPSDVPDKEEAATADMTPAKGGLFEDENGKLFIVDDQGNKKEV